MIRNRTDGFFFPAIKRDAGYIRQSGNLHFRVTGESNESRNNSLSYQSFMYPLHQQLSGRSRGVSQVMHGKSEHSIMGRRTAQPRERKKKHKKQNKIRS